MKPIPFMPVVTGLVLLVMPLRAEEKSSAGLLNDWAREQSHVFEQWDLGGQFRLRLEHKEQFATPGSTAVDFQKTGGNADNTYILTREKFHVGYKASDWLTIYGEARDSRSFNDERSPDPERDPFDLQQAYLVIGDAAKFPLTAKIGRQELSYGDERLIGAFDWNNIGRVFDAVKLRYDHADFSIDGFVSRVVLPNPHEFNVANDYDVFSGIYASTKILVPKQETQFYLLSRNVSPQSPTAQGIGLPPYMTGASARDIYTIGLRVKSLPREFSGWDYDAEVAQQFGDFKSATGNRLDHDAFAAHVAGGYTWAAVRSSPRLGLEYNYASGDSDPADGKHGTFDNLFPTNHKFYGYMDFVSWQNVHDVRFTSTIKPLKKLTLSGDIHAFWRAEENDYFYQVNGAARDKGGYGINPGAGSYLGSEVDVIANYTLSRYAAIQGGYGHFFAGNFIENSLSKTGGAADADWIYLQATVNF